MTSHSRYDRRLQLLSIISRSKMSSRYKSVCVCTLCESVLSYKVSIQCVLAQMENISMTQITTKHDTHNTHTKSNGKVSAHNNTHTHTHTHTWRHTIHKKGHNSPPPPPLHTHTSQHILFSSHCKLKTCNSMLSNTKPYQKSICAIK